MNALDLLLCLLALPMVLPAIYLGVLALVSRARPVPRAAAPPRMRFDLIVPAHDEEAGAPATVASLLALDHPAELFRVIVVADNCTDRTAAVAAAAGARVLVRTDPKNRGKGYALEHAFALLQAEGWADAYVIVDADTLVSPNLLRAFAVRFENGAPALQAEYGVRNPEASWRTRLMRLALTLFHGVRSQGRERLQLSCGLRGNGMAFAARILRDVPHTCYSIIEDLEYGIRLGEAGHRVHYVPEAHVFGEMASGAAASRSQRLRWEEGRRALRRQDALPLLLRSLRERNRVLLDLALDLLVPPLASLTLACGALLATVAIGSAQGLSLPASALVLGLAALSLGGYVARGLVLAGTGWRGLLDLARVPWFLVWKLALAFRKPRGTAEAWVRTERERA